MSTHIVSLLIAERDKLDAAIKALRGSTPKDDSPPEWVTSSSPLKAASEAPAPKKRRTMSAAARKRIGEATRARWAAKREATTAKQAKKTAKK